MKVRCRRILCAAAPLVILGVGIVVLTSDRVPEVKGLSRRDVVQIRALVRRAIWREVLPDRTWDGIKTIPARFWFAHCTEIQCVGPREPDGRMVVLTQSGRIHTTYFLGKHGGRWTIVSVAAFYGMAAPPANKRSGVDAGRALCLSKLRCWPGATHRERSE
jgi:hypothetical protein